MPGGVDGLGFVSKGYADLFRPLDGPFADRDPVELKPPYRVRGASPQQLGVSFFPIGMLTVKVRLPGNKLSVVAIAKGEYMRWAIVESLAEALEGVCRARVRADSILAVTDEVEVLDVHMPYMGDDLWQFCEFRFAYRVKVSSAEEGRLLAHAAFVGMVALEAGFCKALELRFRDFYRLTVLGLANKRYSLMDGQRISDEVDLFIAAASNDADKVLRLLASGHVDVNASQKAARFPAALVDDEELRFACVTLGRPALLAAAEAGHVEMARLLLDMQADVAAQDAAGFHALYLAAGAGKRVVELLVGRSGEVNLANKRGYTALHHACACGECGAIEALLEAKADARARSGEDGLSPVHAAVVNNQPASLERLRDLGADVNMPAFGGNTAVHEGVMQNNPDIIQKLFDLRADVNRQSGLDNDFATPLKMAIGRKKRKAERLLKDLGALEEVEPASSQELDAGVHHGPDGGAG